MPQNWEQEFDNKFPRFACSDDYECPTIRTIGDNQGKVFDGEEIVSGDENIRNMIISFIKQIRQQDMEKLIKRVSFGLECLSDGGHRYQDKIAELIKDYYKQ